MVAVVDYGVGNLFSLIGSLKAIGADAVVTGNEKDLRAADKIILPGVGAFGDAAEKLRGCGLDRVIVEEAKKGKQIMGICLGMQLLFEKGLEYGEHDGLGLVKGKVVSMEGALPKDLKIPHIGWNGLHKVKDSRLLRGVQENDCVYFVHSFYAVGCEESLAATAEYGIALTAAVEKDNVSGCQFHPEKSGRVGLAILKSFVFGE